MEVGNRVFFWMGFGSFTCFTRTHLGSLFSAGAVFAVFDRQAPWEKVTLGNGVVGWVGGCKMKQWEKIHRHSSTIKQLSENWSDMYIYICIDIFIFFLLGSFQKKDGFLEKQPLLFKHFSINCAIFCFAILSQGPEPIDLFFMGICYRILWDEAHHPKPPFGIP